MLRLVQGDVARIFPQGPARVIGPGTVCTQHVCTRRYACDAGGNHSRHEYFVRSARRKRTSQRAQIDRPKIDVAPESEAGDSAQFARLQDDFRNGARLKLVGSVRDQVENTGDGFVGDRRRRRRGDEGAVSQFAVRVASEGPDGAVAPHGDGVIAPRGDRAVAGADLNRRCTGITHHGPPRTRYLSREPETAIGLQTDPVVRSDRNRRKAAADLPWSQLAVAPGPEAAIGLDRHCLGFARKYGGISRSDLPRNVPVCSRAVTKLTRTI